tara:strand:+ start:440 stop:616 length:177 start_codon:yes stop_codon:yes gene_type:complete
MEIIFKYSEVASFPKSVKGFINAFINTIGSRFFKVSATFKPLLFILRKKIPSLGGAHQ